MTTRIDAEDGTVHRDLRRIQTATGDVFFEAIEDLKNTKDICRTVVIDTIDTVERFLRERVLKRLRIKNIEEIGYGKGWIFLREELERLLAGSLNQFIDLGINIVVIGHSTIKKVQPPGLSDAYDRYELKLDPVNCAKLKEWADAVLFIDWDVRITENAQGKVRGIGGKDRVIYTQHSAAHDAKNRVGLPEKLRCEFSELLPLFGTLPAAPKNEAVAKQTKPEVPPDPSSDGDSVQQQLAKAINDIDPEVISLFVRNRRLSESGSILDVTDRYAERALSHLPKFRETLEKFSKEPF